MIAHTWHKLSMILHAWLRKLAETESLLTISFKISIKFWWCKKLSAHSSVIKLSDLIAEYWTLTELSSKSATSSNNEASTSYCLRCSFKPMRKEAKALILACLYCQFWCLMVFDVKFKTKVSNSCESSSKIVYKHLAAASSIPFY